MRFVFALLLTLVCHSLIADTHPLWVLPDGVPDPITADGHYSTNISFTTEAYQLDALSKVVAEANLVANQLELQELRPIVATNLIGGFIHPFGFAYTHQKIGNITTSNYCYFVSVGNRFSYLSRNGWRADCKEYQTKYIWPTDMLDTNAAVLLAGTWLRAAQMDVAALDHDLHLVVKPDNEAAAVPQGSFVPVYYVAWCKEWVDIPGIVSNTKPKWTAVASVRLFLPTKTLLEMRVEDPKYILRPPIVFTNLAFLLSPTNRPGDIHGLVQKKGADR
ncbi:MAG: hypothetical protein P4N59_16025 [Negativicutes bacterium]|nr:hypothetical protein [Negativicutes bacterium]